MNSFLDNIITAFETWVHYYDPPENCCGRKLQKTYVAKPINESTNGTFKLMIYIYLKYNLPQFDA
jgi:hypothetical protein